MKTVRRLCMAVVLMLVFGLAVFAGEMSTPPCSPPDPGEMSTPPCSTTQETSDNPMAGQTSSPPNGGVVTEYVVADTAIDFVESILSLF